MKLLLDTNVVSEIIKPDGNQNVISLLKNVNWKDVYLSALSIGELCYGVERLPASRKKHDLAVWVYMKLPLSFNNRIISLDNDVFTEWGRLRARTKRTIPYDDSLLAAVAISHNMTLVTRNTKDFTGIEGIKLLNPWDK